MNITGIICEYNPFHLGHKKQLDALKSAFPEGGIVCLMSGNYVQRGAPAIVDKSLRAKAAIHNGADLVLELPVTAALSSAEGFAQKGVEILAPFCDRLCFGAETANAERLQATAKALLSNSFSEILHTQLDKGLSFPAARQAALEDLGVDSSCICQPNDILAVEYCKAILQTHHKMIPYPIQRQGDYHDTAPDPENPSATALRQLMLDNQSWESFTDPASADIFSGAVLHTLQAGERAVLARLRCMTEEEFSKIPFGAEGLWRKLMHAVRSASTLEEIISATKSKRYTRTRIDRMILCAFLGITEEMMRSPVPYVRVLALNETGGRILRLARENGDFINIGQRMDDPWQSVEDRCSDLYGLFADDVPEAAGLEQKHRVIYQT